MLKSIGSCWKSMREVVGWRHCRSKGEMHGRIRLRSNIINCANYDLTFDILNRLLNAT